MVLETVILSQDPVTSYNYCKQYSNNNLYNLISGSSFYHEHQLSYEYDYEIFESDVNISNYCDDYSTSNNTSSSKITDDYDICTINDVINSQYFSVEEAPPLMEATPPEEEAAGGGVGRRKRRRRSSKNREEVEQQRMTHIAVERNRRKQMNEYLAAIRSFMPASYAQRGDQASIVGGAINYVKELEQNLQNLEAQKRIATKQKQQPPSEPLTNKTNHINCSNQNQIDHGWPIFGDSFFTFPQYSNRRSMTTCSSSRTSGQETTEMKGKVKAEAAGEIEVNISENHANVRILTKKQPKQLLRLVTAFQGLCLTILHLNVTSFDSSVLYSFSLKVEEGSQFNSVDDIADATNHILMQIQEEADILL